MSYTQPKQSIHYETAGDKLAGKDAERAYRAAQNALGATWPSSVEGVSAYKRIQDKIIGSVLQQSASAIGRRGGLAKTAAKATASRANGKRGGRPRNTDDCRVRVAGHVYTASYSPADGESPECWTVQPDHGDWDRDPGREEALEALADKLTKRWRSPWRVEYSDSTIVRD